MLRLLLYLVAITPGLALAQAPPAPATTPAPPTPQSSGALPPVASPDQQPIQPTSEKQRLRAWLEGKTDPQGRPCVFFAAARTGAASMAVACGPAGLWLVKTVGQGFELAEVRALGGQVVGFFLEGETLWAKVSHLEAVAVEPTAGLSPEDLERSSVSPEPSPRTPTPQIPQAAHVPEPSPRTLDTAVEPSEGETEGEVVSLQEGYAIVTLGSDQGVEPGATIEFLIEERLPVPGDVPAINRRPLAVGVVTRVSSEHSEVRLGINERIPVGAIARLSARHSTESRVAPPRLGGLWEVGGMLRPFLGLNELGGGVLLNAFASYRFQSSFRLMAALDPVGWGNSNEERAVSSITGYVLAAFDTKLFELGFGAGGQTMNAVDAGLATGSATLLLQTVRLGAQDGLYLAARSDVSLFHREFAFSGLRIVGQLPVGRGIWLILRGGGSNAGYGEGELGVRALLHGNGDRGSTFLQVAVGGAQLFRDASCEVQNGRCNQVMSKTEVSGPMGGVGMEWRF